jgi:hypothetical protein
VALFVVRVAEPVAQRDDAFQVPDRVEQALRIGSPPTR